MMLLLKEKARKTAPIKKNCRSMLVFSSTASGKSLVTCLIRVFIWIIMNLRALVRKEENATYLCSACYVFLKRAVRICVARLLNFACHLFCQLFVWSMNTMILILPQCVLYDLFTTDSRLTERDFGKKLRLRSQEVWEMWCSVFKWIGNGWQSLNWMIPTIIVGQ